MTKKITDEELKAIISKEELYDFYITQNKSRKEICKSLNISERIFNNIIKLYNISKKDIVLNNLKDRENKIIDLYVNQNKTLKETAQVLSISLAKVEAIVYRHNVRKNKEGLYKTRVIGRKKFKDITGYTCPFQNPKVREKYKAKTGYDNPNKNPEIQHKRKITCLKKYNAECALSNKEVREKAKNTIKEKYGTENVSQSLIIKRKKIKTTLEHYGVENPSLSKEVINKIWQTKKKCGTTNSSKPEDKIAAIIAESFPDLCRNYATSLYPFQCDFYIPSLDLYIEYQGDPSHGKEPYDANNPKHQKILETWLQKAHEIEEEKGKQSRYTSFIDTWTRRDPLKRQTAAANHLNWHEFFTFDAFCEWWYSQPFSQSSSSSSQENSENSDVSVLSAA